MRLCKSLLVVLAAVAISACGEQPASTSTAKPETQALEVRVAIAAPDTSPNQGYVTQSTLMVEHETDLLVEEEGVLVSVTVDQGRRVRKGDLLARLDDSRMHKTVEQDRAEVRMLEVQARQATVLRDAAEVELMRQTELRKEGLGSMRDFDRARFNLEAMKQEVAKAGFELERAKAKLEEDEIRLNRMQIRAPYDGIVSRRYAREGQKLLRDEKILRVTELRPLLVRFTIPEAHRRTAVEGNVINVVAADASAGSSRAKVIRTGFVVDSASGSVECIAQLQEPVSDSWVPGMGVEVRIPLAGGSESRAASVVPRTALRRIGEDKAEVFVVSGDKLEKREVRMGSETSDGVRVLSGISAGERVALSPQANWQSGMAVRVRP